jgi:hypothetical protein
MPDRCPPTAKHEPIEALPLDAVGEGGDDDLVADVDAALDLPTLPERRKARDAYLARWAARMNGDSPLGAERPEEWRGAYAVRCWYISLDVLLLRNRALWTAVEAHKATTLDKTTVGELRSEPFGPKWSFHSWEKFALYLRNFLSPNVDLRLGEEHGPWQRLYEIVRAEVQAAKAGGQMPRPRLQPNESGINKDDPRAPRLTSIRSPTTADGARQEVDEVRREIHSEWSPAPPAPPRSVDVDSGGAIVREAPPRGTRRLGRWFAGAGAVVVAGLTVTGVHLATGAGVCNLPTTNETTNLFPSSYRGPINLTVCSSSTTPETVHLHLVWGGKHQSVELTNVTTQGRAVTTEKEGLDSTPLTVFISPPAQVSWSTGTLAHAVDINAGWTR